MVHRRAGRQVYEFKCPTRTGRVTVSAGTADKDTAEAMSDMCRALGRRGSRDWDLLDRIAERTLDVGTLFDAYQRNDLDGLRARLADVDLAPYLDRWEAALKGKTAADTRSRYRTQVETLLVPGQAFPRSRLTPEAVDQWVAAQAATGSTRARYFAALRSFVRYLRSIGVLAADPLANLTRPKSAAPRCVFLELADVRRVVDAAPAADRVLYALCYGAGAELGAALATCRRDVLLASREVHLHGTKGRTQGRGHRDRIVRVADWAWPILEAAAAALLPDAPLFTERSVPQASRRHADLLKALGLRGYRLHDSRHHWAVRMARIGTPAELIARQLGHVDATMVLRVYGRFFPSAEEREKWERRAAAQDGAGKVAKLGTTGEHT